MRHIKLLTLLGLCLMIAPYAHAQRIGVDIGVGPGYVGPPVCEWGYYDYYPYACAPYGFYGPEWFSGGVFIGAGPWYHGWGHGGYYGHGYYGRGYAGRGNYGRVPMGGHNAYRGNASGHFNGGGARGSARGGGGGSVHAGGGSRGGGGGHRR
jgi:hypothetical protein